MIRTVLIIGGSGAIGTHLALKFREGYKVFATYNDHPTVIPGVTTIPMRLANRSAGKQVLTLVRPDFIVYAAGHHQIEWAERNARESERAHTAGAGAVSMVSGLAPARLIYLSSSYVFDGVRGNYHEQDTVLPHTMLGKCKLGGENYVRGKSVNHVVLRLGQVLGRGNGIRSTFFDELRIRLGRGERFQLPQNEIHSYVPIWGVIDVVSRLIEGGPKNKILHYGGLTKLSAFDLGRRFAKRFGFDPALITPKLVSLGRRMQDESDAKTYDFSLNSSQLIESLKIKPLLLEESFDLIEQKLVTGA